MIKGSILIVEDEGVLALHIKAALEKAGYEVVATCPSGEKALEKISKKQPDLVLMDVTIRGAMDGIETAERINEDYGIPVIYLTAHSEDNIVERAKITEPYGYIIKPVNPKELQVAVDVAIYKHKLDKERERLSRELSIANAAILKSEKQLKDITSFLNEGICVLNEHGHVTFMNAEAELLLGRTMAELMNINAHNVIHYRNANGSSLSFEECGMNKVMKTGIPFVSRNEVFIRKDGSTFPISVVASPIIEKGKVVAVVTAFRDITERKQIEAEREKLIIELQESLAKVKQLSGFLPICASCKKIRDDKGYWNQIEYYIRDHSEAEFSHGICPDCAQKLYPEFYNKNQDEEDK